MFSTNNSEKKYILLDSCIVQYLLNEHKRDSVGQQLTKWAADIFDFAVSEVSYAELIDGANKNKVKDVRRILDSYSSFPVNKRVMQGCGILGSIYLSKDQSFQRCSMGDKIIATTAFIYNLPVITADVHDFPHPFFTTLNTENISYQKKSKTEWITVDVLLPNTKLLNYYYSKTT